MSGDGAGIGNPHDRELQYYRRECNELGARLLRLQEEQSQTYREARRSRTVVRLVRETYRIGDLAQTAHDVGGPTLEVIVDNALCDSAVFLREEPRGGGRFLVAHAIGIAGAVADAAVSIPNPPSFCYANSYTPANSMSDVLADLLHMPFVLWAYDRSSGCALVIGNRSENNVSRPFEPGDQELVEGALSVYLDVLYRKQAEAQLRQAKQAAEEANQERTRLLADLSQNLIGPLRAVAAASEALASDLAPTDELERQHGRALRIVRDVRRLTLLAEGKTLVGQDKLVQGKSGRVSGACAIRFHLAAGTEVTPVEDMLRLKLSSGATWSFLWEGAEMRVEDSVRQSAYFGFHRTRQIVLDAAAADGPEISWIFTLEEKT